MGQERLDARACLCSIDSHTTGAFCNGTRIVCMIRGLWLHCDKGQFALQRDCQLSM
jgi:hypothetical protein